MTTVDVDRDLEPAKLRGPALVVLVCAASTLILDGFDIQAVGVRRARTRRRSARRASGTRARARGVRSSAWHSAPPASAFSAIAGADAAHVLILSTRCSAPRRCSLRLRRASRHSQLWRLITGIGLGGALTAATALIAEFSPRKLRSLAIGAIQVGVPIGGMLGAALAAELIPVHGWRSVFLVGGVLPLARGGDHVFRAAGVAALPQHAAAGRAGAGSIARDDRSGGRYHASDTFVLSDDVPLASPAYARCSRRNCAGTPWSCRSRS